MFCPVSDCNLHIGLFEEGGKYKSRDEWVKRVNLVEKQKPEDYCPKIVGSMKIYQALFTAYNLGKDTGYQFGKFDRE